MTKQKFITDPKKLLLKIAAMWANDPKTWTTRMGARDAYRRPINPHSDQACRFCAIGALSRFGHEKTPAFTNAYRALYKQTTGIGIVNYNDSRTKGKSGALEMADLFRRAAATL